MNKQQAALTIIGIDQWVQLTSETAVEAKYCGIRYGQRSGLLAVSPVDINEKTRVTLQKLLQALQVKTTRQYTIEANHDGVWIIGTSLASSLTGVEQDYAQWQSQTATLPGKHARLIVTPSLTAMQDDIALKKLVWKELSAYFL